MEKGKIGWDDMEAVILAGGLGTRIRSAIGDNLPKSLAPVNGFPFLYHLLKRLHKYGFKHVIVSCGYKAEMIRTALCTEDIQKLGLDMDVVAEDPDKLLGTGGAMRRASQFIRGERFFVFNGDTYTDMNVENMLHTHLEYTSDITIALRYVEDVSRYGVVRIDQTNRIITIEKTNDSCRGIINSGTYLIEKRILDSIKLNTILSMEYDVILPLINKGYRCYGFLWDGYFIDIGIASDYDKFKEDVLMF